LLRHCSHWLLRQRDRSLAVDARVRQLRPAILQLVGRWPQLVSADERARVTGERDALIAAGAPAALASMVASADTLAAAFDIVELAAATRLRPTEVAEGWHELGQRLGLDWLGRRIDALSVEGPWQAAARRDLRDGAQQLHRALMQRALADAKGSVAARVTAWIARGGSDLEAWQRMLTEMKTAAAADFATLSVGVEGVRRLLH
jgi:glutamate dehydrogenase